MTVVSSSGAKLTVLYLNTLHLLDLFKRRKLSFTSPLLTQKRKHYRLECPVQKAHLINVTTAVLLLTMQVCHFVFASCSSNVS